MVLCELNLGNSFVALLIIDVRVFETQVTDVFDDLKELGIVFLHSLVIL